MTDSNPIDPDALERLREWGGEKLVGQMIRLYLENSEARMEQIRVGASTGDLREAEQGAHSLKSSAANVGAQEVRSLAARIEEACIDGNDARFRELVPGLEDEFASARAALESLERDMSA